MLLLRVRQYRLIINLILFASINFCDTQTNITEFRSSNIEIIPNLVVINSTSITDFICINHQSNGTQLETKLSKSIPFNQMKISTNLLNKTAMHIRLESNNYVGIFHLLCYSRGEQPKGNRADVIVKDAPGVLQLAEPCRVYDRQYIKCTIRASVIASAIQNGYPPTFEFNEIIHSSDRKAYSRFEFLKNESTNEYLIFKWKPTTEGEFPNGVRMNMKAILPYFNESSYYFDMTPIFRIKPKFSLKLLSSNEIQIDLTPASPSAFCEKSIVPQLVSNINRTWTIIEPERNTILNKNLLYDSIYRVCIKCRQVYNDPDGLEECQEIKTLSRIDSFFNQKYSHIIIITPIVILLMIIGSVLYFRYKPRKIDYEPGMIRKKIIPIGVNQNHYDIDPSPHARSNGSIFADDDVSEALVHREPIDNDRIHDEPQNTYLSFSVASINGFILASTPIDLSPPEIESNS